MRRSSIGALCFFLFLPVVLAQNDAVPQESMAYCTFEDNSQLTVRYKKVELGKKASGPPNGKIWSPGDVPMLLFTETPILVGTTELNVGAYSVYTIPEKDRWTLIINKNVAANSPYDQQQDVVRVPMSIGKLSRPVTETQVSVGHIGQKLCILRVDVGSTGAWADVFRQK